MGCLSSKNSVGVVITSDPSTSDSVQANLVANENHQVRIRTPGGGSVKSHDSGYVDRNVASNADTIQKPVLPAIKSSNSSQAAVNEERLPIAREEGLMVQRSLTSTAYGFSFEVVDAEEEGREPMMRRRLPVRLAKLEGKPRTITDEEIKAKLERAERRKRNQEQLRLERIRSLQITNVNSANEAMLTSLNDAALVANLKSEKAAENRDRLLRERRLRMASAGRLRKPQVQPPASPDILNHRPVGHSPLNDVSATDEVMMTDTYTNVTSKLEDHGYTMGRITMEADNSADFDEADRPSDKTNNEDGLTGIATLSHVVSTDVLDNDVTRNDDVEKQSVQTRQWQTTTNESDVLSSGNGNKEYSSVGGDGDVTRIENGSDDTGRVNDSDVTRHEHNRDFNRLENDADVIRPENENDHDVTGRDKNNTTINDRDQNNYQRSEMLTRSPEVDEPDDRSVSPTSYRLNDSSSSTLSSF